MPSATAFFVAFSVVVFLGGSGFGVLLLFIISIHRTRRTSLFKTTSQRRGEVSRCLLVTTRTHRKGGGN